MHTTIFLPAFRSPYPHAVSGKVTGLGGIPLGACCASAGGWDGQETQVNR